MPGIRLISIDQRSKDHRWTTSATRQGSRTILGQTGGRNSRKMARFGLREQIVCCRCCNIFYILSTLLAKTFQVFFENEERIKKNRPK